MSINQASKSAGSIVDERNQPTDCGIDLSADADWNRQSESPDSLRSDVGDGVVSHQVRWCDRLQRIGVSSHHSQELIRELTSSPDFDIESSSEQQLKRLASILQKRLRTIGPIRSSAGEQRVIAFVGPTGVGKTTTIAKLASQLSLGENKKIGLITVDTYRIAAVDQLRTYAQIIDVPLEVVSTPREMQGAISKLSDCDLLLIDTAGRSPKNDLQLQELKSILASANTNEIHLVLNAVASRENLSLVIEKFHRVGVDALLISKVDETTTLTNFAQVAIDTDLPFSYLSNGQNVPDDIELASSSFLAESFLDCHI